MDNPTVQTMDFPLECNDLQAGGAEFSCFQEACVIHASSSAPQPSASVNPAEIDTAQQLRQEVVKASTDLMESARQKLQELPARERAKVLIMWVSDLCKEAVAAEGKKSLEGLMKLEEVNRYHYQLEELQRSMASSQQVLQALCATGYPTSCYTCEATQDILKFLAAKQEWHLGALRVVANQESASPSTKEPSGPLPGYEDGAAKDKPDGSSPLLVQREDGPSHLEALQNSSPDSFSAGGPSVDQILEFFGEHAAECSGPYSGTDNSGAIAPHLQVARHLSSISETANLQELASGRWQFLDNCEEGRGWCRANGQEAEWIFPFMSDENSDGLDFVQGPGAGPPEMGRAILPQSQCPPQQRYHNVFDSAGPGMQLGTSPSNMHGPVENLPSPWMPHAPDGSEIRWTMGYGSPPGHGRDFLTSSWYSPYGPLYANHTSPPFEPFISQDASTLMEMWDPQDKRARLR